MKSETKVWLIDVALMITTGLLFWAAVVFWILRLEAGFDWKWI